MVNLKLYAWISRGKQRIPIMKAMYKPMTPTEIRKHSIWDNPKISLFEEVIYDYGFFVYLPA